MLEEHRSQYCSDGTMSVLILSKRAHMHAHTQEEGERSTACKRTRCSRVAQTKTIQAPILDALLTTIVPENITAASRRGRGWYSPAVAEKLAALSTVRATWWISCSRVNKHSGRESYTDGRTHTHTHTHTHTYGRRGRAKLRAEAISDSRCYRCYH